MTDLRPTGQHADDGLTHDLEAALAARRELGESYERALAESFLARIESQIDARVDARVQETVGRRSAESQHQKQQLSLGIVSLALGIPITAVAGGVADGLPGVLVAWAGIAGVNLAHALRGRGPGMS
jgi:hypothetical protein